MKIFTKKNKIIIGVVSLLLISWIYVCNGIPYFAYKTTLEINKSSNSVNLKLFPSNKILELCPYDKLVDIESNYDFLHSFFSRTQDRGVTPQTNLTLITSDKKINIYPHIKAYEASSKIEEVKNFQIQNDDIYRTTFEDFGKLKYFLFLIVIISVLCFGNLEVRRSLTKR